MKAPKTIKELSEAIAANKGLTKAKMDRACHMSCIKRSASIACARCCRDQSYLCDMQQKHSFEACENER